MAAVSSATAQRYARISGAMYMYIIVGGMFMGLFVRPGIVLPGDAAETAARMLAGESTFRIGIVAELFTIAADMVVAAFLYVLFRPVDRGIALLAAFTRLAADILLAISSILQAAALRMVDARQYLQEFTADQTNALALLAMNLHSDGYAICLFIFGFALLALGHVAWRATYFPRTIAALLAIAGACYVINSAVYFVAPSVSARLEPAIYLPMFIGELALALWLLIKGVDRLQWDRVHESNHAIN